MFVLFVFYLFAPFMLFYKPFILYYTRDLNLLFLRFKYQITRIIGEGQDNYSKTNYMPFDLITV